MAVNKKNKNALFHTLLIAVVTSSLISIRQRQCDGFYIKRSRIPMVILPAQHGRNQRSSFSRILSISRGGDTGSTANTGDLQGDETHDEEEIEDEGEDETETETETEEEEEEEEEEDDDEDNGGDVISEDEDNIEEIGETDTEKKETPSMPTTPLKIVIRTNINSPLIDQTLELNASRNRSIESVKLSIFRQMRGRPPVSSQTLLLGTRVLMDDELLNDLAPLDEDEDEDEDDDEESIPSLNLILDIPPPIDPKFATDLGGVLEKMSTADILDAYVANAASMEQVASWMLSDETKEKEEDDDDMEDDSKEDVSLMGSSSSTSSIPKSVTMRKQALSVKEQLLSTFPEEVLKLLEEPDDEDEENAHDTLLSDSIKRKTRVRMKGGAKMVVKRSLQKNINIDWPATIRTCLLFLFFGHFGARDSLSRALMLWGAPLCFIIQLRPIKIALKQLFYAIGEPPGIILSLLPAPQQVIMGLNYEKMMKDLYGVEMEEGEAETKMGDADGEDEQEGETEEEEEETDFEEYEEEYDDEDE